MDSTNLVEVNAKRNNVNNLMKSNAQSLDTTVNALISDLVRIQNENLDIVGLTAALEQSVHFQELMMMYGACTNQMLKDRAANLQDLRTTLNHEREQSVLMTQCLSGLQGMIREINKPNDVRFDLSEIMEAITNCFELQNSRLADMQEALKLHSANVKRINDDITSLSKNLTVVMLQLSKQNNEIAELKNSLVGAEKSIALAKNMSDGTKKKGTANPNFKGLTDDALINYFSLYKGNICKIAEVTGYSWNGINKRCIKLGLKR